MRVQFRMASGTKLVIGPSQVGVATSMIVMTFHAGRHLRGYLRLMMGRSCVTRLTSGSAGLT
jgi:hypothetical protein